MLHFTDLYFLIKGIYSQPASRCQVFKFWFCLLVQSYSNLLKLEPILGRMSALIIIVLFTSMHWKQSVAKGLGLYIVERHFFDEISIICSSPSFCHILASVWSPWLSKISGWKYSDQHHP